MKRDVYGMKSDISDLIPISPSWKKLILTLCKMNFLVKLEQVLNSSIFIVISNIIHRKNCPLLQSELLKTGVGCEKEFS